MISKTELASMIDHTILKPDAIEADIIRLCEEAAAYGFGAVCINPHFIPTAKKALQNSSIKICTVIGFPLGSAISSVKVFEAQEALAMGAMELDMVINISALKDKQDAYVKNEIAAIVKASKNKALVKVIIETCFLTSEEIVRASILSKQSGADFVKTSTGFGPFGAKADDVALMRDTVGSIMGVKASGGIRSLDDALMMINAGATRLGTSSGIKIIDTLMEKEKQKDG